MIPLVLDLKDKLVTIFGGGEVGLRKAAFFSKEARVMVVSRSFSPGFEDLDIQRISSDIEDMPDNGISRLMNDSFLAVGATSDPKLNARIGRLCQSRGILFNNATGEDGDVIIPSTISGDNYCIAITTYGMSPAIPRYLRQHMEEEFSSLDGMIKIQHELRRMLKETQPSQEKRTKTLWAVLRDPEIWELLDENYIKALNCAKKRYIDG
jgi:precorrin-2 dehydrogenase/sirohydrochlorin ferrochelatase